MSKFRELSTRVLTVIGGLALVVGLLVASNASFWITEGNPTVPSLTGRWWGGYFETSSGKRWCVARFIGTKNGGLRMALLSGDGPPHVFDVSRSSSDRAFVHLTFSNKNVGARIKAKEMYEGKRYYLGRLMVGRFGDFWKQNHDVAIRGQLVSSSPRQNWGIEPISDAKLEWFWSEYVHPGSPRPSPAEILERAGMGSD